jgi:nucleoid-associated protein YgaU
MTSEAKIGLLLGLVFIFIIAFIINGLPSFWHKSDNTEMTVATESAENDAAGIADNQRKAGESIEKIAPAAVSNTGQVAQAQSGSEVRSTLELPKDSTKSAANTELQPITVAQALPPQDNAQSPEVHQQTPAQSEQKTYVVCQGDSLFTIAKKFYGTSEANKKSTTELLFNANHGVLKSPHSLQIGQKLVIPQIADNSTKKSKVETAVAEPAKTQHTKTTQATETKQTAAADNKTKSSKDYVVQSGDSLWKIAAKQLGNGSRYDEIAELNSNVLKDGENVVVGMHLKMPAK